MKKRILMYILLIILFFVTINFFVDYYKNPARIIKVANVVSIEIFEYSQGDMNLYNISYRDKNFGDLVKELRSFKYEKQSKDFPICDVVAYDNYYTVHFKLNDGSILNYIYTCYGLSVKYIQLNGDIEIYSFEDIKEQEEYSIAIGRVLYYNDEYRQKF